MSANNYIRIEKTKKGFTARECDADTHYCNKPFFIGKTLERAIEEAQQYDFDNMVEYGISFGKLK